MREIKLTQNKVALVDDEAFDRLNKYKWHFFRGHHDWTAACRGVGLAERKRQVFMHHAVIGYPPKYLMVDHIDGNGLNNQRNNLRFVTMRQNQQNQHKNKTSKYPGVYWKKSNNGWGAQININGNKKHLGTFSNECDAFCAYKKAVEGLGETVLQSNPQEERWGR